MKDKGIRAGTIIIIVGDIKVESNSFGIGKIDHDDQSSATRASMKDIGMHTIHTNIETISIFVPVVVSVITL